jgi:hypothetical protein
VQAVASPSSPCAKTERGYEVIRETVADDKRIGGLSVGREESVSIHAVRRLEIRWVELPAVVDRCVSRAAVCHCCDWETRAGRSSKAAASSDPRKPGSNVESFKTTNRLM